MHLLSNTSPSMFSKNVCDMLGGPSMLSNPFYSLGELTQSIGMERKRDLFLLSFFSYPLRIKTERGR